MERAATRVDDVIIYACGCIYREVTTGADGVTGKVVQTEQIEWCTTHSLAAGYHGKRRPEEER